MGEHLNLRILFLSIFSANWEKAVIPFKLRMLSFLETHQKQHSLENTGGGWGKQPEISACKNALSDFNPQF